MRHALQPVDDLPRLKVPRRYRRAFDRLSAPKAPPQRLLIVAGTALVFAVGFLFGRVLSQTPSTPTVHALPPAAPLQALDVDGSAAYLLWSPGERLATISAHDLYSGEVAPRARFSPPVPEPGERTQLVGLGRDVALVLGGDDGSFVAVAPSTGAPFAWVPGVEAAWEGRGSLLIRAADGRVSRWSSDTRSVIAKVPGAWDQVVQTASGAVLRRGEQLVLRDERGQHRTISVPRGAKLLASNAEGSRMLISSRGLALWDGHTAKTLRIEGYAVAGASFSPAGDRVAVTLRDTDGSVVLGVADEHGNVALKPVSARAAGCGAVPAWDARGKWLYVAPGDGSIYAVEAAGGRTESVPARLVGCGLAWFAS
jgi:hypothetical protein